MLTTKVIAVDGQATGPPQVGTVSLVHTTNDSLRRGWILDPRTGADE